MKYSTYLKNKNLSKITINIYLKNSEKWLLFLNGKNPNKTLFVKFINNHRHLSANSIRILYSSIISFIRFQKKWKLINQFKDIRLPTIVQYNKEIISLSEYESVKNNIVLNTWSKQRNWLLFSFLFYTGIRGFELNQINKSNIVNNKIKLIGKGNKQREIFIPIVLMEQLLNWKHNYININKKGKKLSHKQLNSIIKKIGITMFNKNISSHSLRRSYATNLLRNNVDIKTVSKLMGHSNINTTSRYIHLTNDEIFEKIEYVFK